MSTFQLATTLPTAQSIMQNGLQYFFSAPQDLQIDEQQNGVLNAGYQFTQIPSDSLFQLSPSDELIGNQINSAIKHVKPTDIGASASLFYKNVGKKKTIKKGTRIFKGILKKMGFDALDILPFVGNLKKNKLRSNRDLIEWNDHL